MAEILARLTAKVQDWLRMPGGSPDRLTPEMLAQALAGLPRGPYLLARATYADDETVLEELEVLILTDVAPRVFELNDVGSLSFLRHVVRVALEDVVQPPKCPRCQGRGHTYERRGVVRDCTHCEGGGRLQVGRKRMMQRLGVGKRRWMALEASYRRLEAILWAWRGQVAGHVRSRLRSHSEAK